MKKLILFVTFFIAMTINSSAQSTITGLIKDEFGQPVPTASIEIIDTKKAGTYTDFNGEFKLNSHLKSGEIKVSSIGFETKIIPFNEKEKINIVLESSSVGLDEVLLIASTTIDRKTPVATSKITKEDIELKLGTQEFVEIFKSTPGVYTSKAGGGFGDGEIQMRGFNSENVGVLINGIPVNDMESGKVYWSNWAGIGSVTASTQTQRGLGASKVAVPAIGGTVNIVTETTEADNGGFFSYGLGNNGYNKYAFKYSTGLMDNGLAVTAYVDRTYGNGYVDGTNFSAVSYFTNVSYKINKAHKLSLTVFGSTQSHGQRQTKSSINDIRSSARGIRYNPSWGYKQGQVTSIKQNFFNKPQISLNHYWKINENNKLSTAVYLSVGTGGGGSQLGTQKNKLTDGSYQIGKFGTINFDQIVQENRDNGTNGATAVLVNSRNDHFWTGILSTLISKVSEKITLTNGIDARAYIGKHYQQVSDLLGGQYYLDNKNINNPNNAAQVGDKVGYYNDGVVNVGGVFSQIEYDYEKISAFATLNISETQYKRIDYFQKTPGNQETNAVNFLGGGLKGGANYRIDNYNNIFFNTGYFQRAPYLKTVWPTYNNDQTNKNAKNQKIFSAEIGYGLRTSKFSANINLYRTQWNDKSQVQNFQQPDGTTAFANITGVNALHKGVEFDFEYRPINNLKLTGMLSVGDWKWSSNVKNVAIIDQNQNVIDHVNIYIKDTPVGNAAQTTAALGLNYTLAKKTTFIIDCNYFDRYYANFNPGDRNTPGLAKPWELPSVSLFDGIISHKFNVKNFDAKITARVNNLLNTQYISVANYTNGTAAGALVWYGTGRTFSISTVINF